MLVSVSHFRNEYGSDSIAQQNSCVMYELTLFTRKEHPFGLCMSYEFWIILQKYGIKSQKTSFFIYTGIVWLQSHIF